MFLVLAGIIQFGLLFWAQNTLTQIARDTGRWAATQRTCDTGPAVTAVVGTANQIAASSALIGYNGGWTSPANVNVSWRTESTMPPSQCPPVGNQQVAYVRIELRHQVPVFFVFLPIDGNLVTETEFRMEPIAE